MMCNRNRAADWLRPALDLYLRQRGYVFAVVCVSVCKISQKVTNGFG